MAPNINGQSTPRGEVKEYHTKRLIVFAIVWRPISTKLKGIREGLCVNNDGPLIDLDRSFLSDSAY